MWCYLAVDSLKAIDNVMGWYSIYNFTLTIHINYYYSLLYTVFMVWELSRYRSKLQTCNILCNPLHYRRGPHIPKTAVQYKVSRTVTHRTMAHNVLK